jgi:hypothetical protein
MSRLLRRDMSESCNSTASGSAAIYAAFRESRLGDVPVRWHRARRLAPHDRPVVCGKTVA